MAESCAAAAGGLAGARACLASPARPAAAAWRWAAAPPAPAAALARLAWFAVRWAFTEHRRAYFRLNRPASADFLGAGGGSRRGDRERQPLEASAALDFGPTSSIIWPLLAAWPNSLASKGRMIGGLQPERLAEVLGGNLRAAGRADHVEHQHRRRVVRPRLADQVDDVLGVAQGGQVGRGGDHHVIGAEQGAAHPARPQMRQVEHHIGRRRADLAGHLLEGVGGDVVVHIQRRRRGEQAEAVAAAGHHPVEQHRVQPVGLAERVGHALQGILVEVETGGAERQVEIDDHRIGLHRLAEQIGEIVRHGR